MCCAGHADGEGTRPTTSHPRTTNPHPLAPRAGETYNADASATCGVCTEPKPGLGATVTDVDADADAGGSDAGGGGSGGTGGGTVMSALLVQWGPGGRAPEVDEATLCVQPPPATADALVRLRGVCLSEGRHYFEVGLGSTLSARKALKPTATLGLAPAPDSDDEAEAVAGGGGGAAGVESDEHTIALDVATGGVVGAGQAAMATGRAARKLHTAAVVGCVLDMDNRRVEFNFDGVPGPSLRIARHFLAGAYAPMVVVPQGCAMTINVGQATFQHKPDDAVPVFDAMCTCVSL